MDVALIAYLKDKKQYLKDFAMGKYIINPLLVGMIFSISQQDIGNDMILLESIERLINDLYDPICISYCIGKFYKSSNDYIKSIQNPLPNFTHIYYRIGMLLSNFEIIPSIKAITSNYFAENFSILLQNYSKTTDFMKIYKIGRKNINFFPKVPEIFFFNLDDELEKISLVRESVFLQGLIQTLYCLCNKILYKNISEIGVYIATIIKIIYKEKINKEIIIDFSKNLSQFHSIFTEETCIELDRCHCDALKFCGVLDGVGLFSNIQTSNSANFRRPDNFDNQLRLTPPQLSQNLKSPTNYIANNSSGMISSQSSPLISEKKPKSLVKIAKRAYDAPNHSKINQEFNEAPIANSKYNPELNEVLTDILAQHRKN